MVVLSVGSAIFIFLAHVSWSQSSAYVCSLEAIVGSLPRGSEMPLIGLS